MKLIEINRQPTDRQLRQFGAICAVALPMLGAVWKVDSTIVATLLVTGFVMAMVGFVLPKLLKPFFLAMTFVATPIGVVLGELSMLLIYFGIFLPFAVVFRMIHRDALQRTLTLDRSSYWQSRKQPEDIKSYYRQF